jgi:DNA replication and repair protein RecF
LDDVMSELDQDRRAALTGLIQQDIQTFVTTTNTGYFEPGLLESADVVTTGGDA